MSLVFSRLNLGALKFEDMSQVWRNKFRNCIGVMIGGGRVNKQGCLSGKDQSVIRRERIMERNRCRGRERVSLGSS